MIENVGRMAGMPVGPLSLNDEVAVDLAWKILKATEADLGADAVDPEQKALLADHGREATAATAARTARASTTIRRTDRSGCGPGSPDLQPTKLDPDTIDVDGARSIACSSSRRSRPRAAFEEGVITDVREADVGSILGFGFAPFTGGTLSYIDMMGTKTFVELCKKLAKKYGPRFKPSKLLLDMAKKGETFYGRFAPDKRKAA